MTDHTIALHLMRRGVAGWWHKCPACGVEHPLPSSWEFDGNEAKPTFKPSFNQFPSEPEKRCHYFIRGGQIEWSEGSWHGRTGIEPMVYYDTGA